MSGKMNSQTADPLSGRQPGTQFRGHLLPAALAALLSVSLAGCNTASKNVDLTTGSINNPVHSERHPISVHNGAVELKVEVLPRVHSLSPSQRIKVGRFLSAYRSVGAGPLTVAMPRGAMNHSAANGVMRDIRVLLKSGGIPRGAIESVNYPAERGLRNPPLILKYSRYYAKASPCGNWPGNLARDYSNRPYPNFACASQNNLAAMVANPRDLVAPRTMTGGDVRRRMIAYDKYLKGEVTAAERSNDEKSTVSDVGSSK